MEEPSILDYIWVVQQRGRERAHLGEGVAALIAGFEDTVEARLACGTQPTEGTKEERGNGRRWKPPTEGVSRYDSNREKAFGEKGSTKEACRAEACRAHLQPQEDIVVLPPNRERFLRCSKKRLGGSWVEGRKGTEQQGDCC